jgi:hypothetical protein
MGEVVALIVFLGCILVFLVGHLEEHAEQLGGMRPAST